MNALLNRLITNATAPIGKNKRAPLQTGHALFRSHELPVRQLDISYNRSFMFVQSLARTAIAAFSAGGLILGRSHLHRRCVARQGGPCRTCRGGVWPNDRN